ncbi:ABC transporter ATP-binding protein [Mollicutes bacterium LVI A0078]|nr:ABC transporter ATP-binding protein [Mollicutes bacterium LVI A0075]WOO91338.1 ABC transporter ATP-binding protein [Mollicutes bacterium LVI A0078]
MNEIFSVENLSMSIGKKTIFEDITFKVYSGEIIGLLGHNGVGKSTMQRIIANRENAQAGTIVNNGRVQTIATDFNNIVYVPDVIILIPNLTVIENFELIAKSRNCNINFFESYIKTIRLTGKEQVKSLSKGNQELVQIIILLSINAAIYLLDEPFSAVDVFRRELIQKIIIDLSLRNESSSVIITSHLINEIEPMLSRVLYLDEGHIVIDKDLDQIYEQSNNLLQYLKDHFGEKVGYDNV